MTFSANRSLVEKRKFETRMKSAYRSKRFQIAGWLMLPLVGLAILAANKPNEFDQHKLPLLVTEGDFQSAVREADHAIAVYQDLVAAGPKEGGGSMRNGGMVGYYMCAKAQLLALRGDFVGADRILSEVKTYASDHSTFLIDWETLVSSTHAFILEKSGKRDEAKKAYESPSTQYGQGRLALLALEAGDDTKARQLAVAAEINPTAYLVLGRLEEKDGHKQAALEWYNKAWGQLHSVGISQPIYFCEGPAIATARKRLEK